MEKRKQGKAAKEVAQKKLSDTLKSNPRNPNRMDDCDKARMARSLNEFGDLSGIIFNKRTGLLVGGHQRTSIIQDGKIVITEKLNKPESDGTTARGYVLHLNNKYIYREVDWPESKANAAMISANRFSRLGHDEPSILKDLLQELDTGELDMALTGYSAVELEKLMTQSSDGSPITETLHEQSIQLFPKREYVMIVCDELNTDFDELKTLLKLKMVRRGGYKEGSAFDDIGLQRVITAKDLFNIIKERTNVNCNPK